MLKEIMKNETEGAFKNANFMTPVVLGYYQAGRYTFELSKGKGFTGGNIFGVTVAKDGKHLEGKGDCCESRQKAIEFMDEFSD